MTLGLYRTRWVMLSYSPFPRKKLRFSSRIWDNWWANGHFVCKVLHDTHAFSFLLLPFSIRSTNRRLLSVCVGFLWAGCWDWAVPTSKQNSLSSGNLSCRCVTVTAGDGVYSALVHFSNVSAPFVEEPGFLPSSPTLPKCSFVSVFILF